MLRATLFIIACAARNQLRRRLRRLREPRYLFGALVGAAYFYFVIFGRLRFSRRPRRARSVPLAFLPMAGGSGPLFAGLAMLAAAASSLLLPIGSGLLSFSRAESEFLLASPVSSRELLIYRLMRSQIGVLFSAMIIALTYPLATPAIRLRGFVGSWLVLVAAQMFFAGVAVTRVPPWRRSMRARVVAWLPRTLLAAAVAVVVVDAYRFMLMNGLRIDSAWEVFSLLDSSMTTGWSRVVLSPFIVLTAPLFATSHVAFVAAMPGALLVLAIVVAWVLSADEAFEAMTDRLAQGQGRASSVQPGYNQRASLWTLPTTGRVETMFVWKTVTQVVRGVNRGVLFKLVLVVVWITLVLMLFSRSGRGITQVTGIFAALAAGFAVVLGPQMLRYDLRQDLQRLDLLKTWPVRASSVIRGQIFGTALAVTVVAWCIGAVALSLSAAAFPRTLGALRISAGVSAFIVAPALILAQYAVHNAAALFFPAWFASSGSRPRGIDAIGQRIIMLAGTWFVLLTAIVPSALIGGALWWLFEPIVGPWILIPAAIVATLLVFVEVALAAEVLAPVYEQLDVTSVEPAS